MKSNRGGTRPFTFILPLRFLISVLNVYFHLLPTFYLCDNRIVSPSLTAVFCPDFSSGWHGNGIGVLFTDYDSELKRKNESIFMGGLLFFTMFPPSDMIWAVAGDSCFPLVSETPETKTVPPDVRIPTFLRVVCAWETIKDLSLHRSLCQAGIYCRSELCESCRQQHCSV